MSSDKTRCRIIGIAGGSCSGKTTFAKLLHKQLGAERCALLYQDSYYIDQSSRFKEDGGEVNFDHPSAIDFDLLATHLIRLKSGAAIEVPIYDFVTHTRRRETEHFANRPFVLVDGILILSQPQVRAVLDEKLFIDCSEDLRFDRRKARDVRERGRTVEGVVKQFMNHVKPMHDKFVEPSRMFADRIVADTAVTDFAGAFARELGLD